MKMKPVPRNSMVDTVVERISGLIQKDGLCAGTRLPSELELVQQLQVSRPVLREAIGRLETMGLLTVRRGLGTFVGDQGSLMNCVRMLRSAMTIAPKELYQVAEFRRMIECQSARRAAELAQPSDVAELAALLEQMDRPDQDHLEAIRLDFLFHRQLAVIAGNAIVLNCLEVIQEFVLAGMVHTTSQPRNHQRSQQLHRAIFDGIRTGNPDAAETAMKEHMDSVDRELRKAAKREQAAG
jgi:GntR family transcriptional repressor for pyruvate dehydrogenase complex